MNNSNLLKGLVAGAVAGAAGSWVMNGLISLYPAPTSARGHGAQSIQPGQPEHGLGALQSRNGRPGEHHDEDAAERMAEMARHALTGAHSTGLEKQRLGKLVHYAFGASSAAVYGALVEICPWMSVGYGAGFGAAVWLGADEGTVPAMGLSKGPSELPLSVHMTALGTHLAYGMTSEFVRRRVRSLL